MSFTGHENNSISFEEGGELTKAYRDKIKTGDVIGVFYSKDSIQALLDQPDSVGIRAYFGTETDGQNCLVIVGVDKDENDQIDKDFKCVDGGSMCPPNCSTTNILNS